MKEFVFGTAQQFAELDQMLDDNQCHVFHSCVLPDCCSQRTARLGFEKTCEGYYLLYIDKNIHAETANKDFERYLANGEIKFICQEDMISFLHSLQPMFETEEQPVQLMPETEERPVQLMPEMEEQPVYDQNKVKELKQEADQPKMVWPEEIAEPLKKKVFGQDNVIDEISRKIVINKMRKDKKLLVMAFIGPTATGKSETAKALAEVLSDCYGTPYGFIEIAGSEFISEHTINRFFGAPPGYVGYGEEPVLGPVRKNPRHVIVINEVEKANLKLLEGLMEAIDTGYLGMADNSKPIDLNECILCFTSNISIDREGFDKLSKFEKEEVCRDAFTKHCHRPEISGKIGNFVVFNELSDTATMDIVVKFVKEELSNFNLRLARIDEGLMVDFLNHQTKYGARGIRNLVSDSLGEQLLNGRKLEELKDHSVSLKGTIAAIEFEIGEEMV
jgi:ATP-dependent Clp protease ATP-binding subunit ClpA